VLVALGLWATGLTVVVRALVDPGETRITSSPAAETRPASPPASRRRSGSPTTTDPGPPGRAAGGDPPAPASRTGLAPAAPGAGPLTAPTTGAVPSAPAAVALGAAARVGRAAAIADPSANVAPAPDFFEWCSSASYSDSLACTEAALEAIDNARAREQIGPLVLPEDWDELTPQEQLFAVTNLERTARGLPPMEVMSTILDAQAAAGAADGDDPGPGSLAVTSWGSNWGDGVGSALEIDYEWMYDDGPGSPNVACPANGGGGCWGHRHNILLALPCRECVLGTGFQNTDAHGYAAWTLILAEATDGTEVDFTWSDVVAGDS
jgi:hypothetical protein